MRNFKIGLMMTLILALMFFAIPLLPVRAEETLIWSGDVDSNGATTTGPVLDAFMQYRVVAKEIFWVDFPTMAADAMYYTDSPPEWVWVNFFPAPEGHSFLQIDEKDVNWGPFNNGNPGGSAAGGHNYSIYYEGTGEAITFRIVDWVDGNYTNNYCHLPVEIYELPMETGYTPGFWKHNIGVALGYNPGTYSAFRDGTKLTEALLEMYAATVVVTLQEAYAALTAKGPHMDTVRADMANAFNAAAGHGPFVDSD
jgi:hypothetical protein